MWTTIYVASGREWASEIEEKLRAEGFIIKVKYFGCEGGERSFMKYWLQILKQKIFNLLW